MCHVNVCGGCIAPEVSPETLGWLSHKSDAYSTRMMIFEIVGKRKLLTQELITHSNTEKYFPHWIYRQLELDEGLKLQYNLNKGEELANSIAARVIVKNHTVKGYDEGG